MAPTSSSSSLPLVNALTSSYNEQIRPLLDAVDRLRQLKVMQEGIELPTTVVVGDQSSGKSSDDPSLSSPQLHLEYRDKRIETSEKDITLAIEIATSEIAGSGKGISDTPLTLVVRCVRNRIGAESYEEARASEAELFSSHHLLSRIDKSIVGIPVLAERLMRIQAQSIAKCLPNIVKKINEKLNVNVSELDGMPQNLVSVADAMRAFMQIISRAKETLKKLLIRGEYEDYPDENQMHGAARLVEMLNAYAKDLPADIPSKGSFLVEEIAILEEARGIGLPNFLPRTAFLTLLQMKVKEISGMPHDFVLKVWCYIEDVILRVLDEAAENYPPLQACTRRAAQNLVEKMRRKSREVVKEFIEMEMITDYTCNPDYMKMWVELMDNQDAFMELIHNHSKPAKMSIKVVGEINVAHLRGKHAGLIEQAFDIRMRLIAYWKCVVLRLVDVLALHVRYAVRKLVDKELESEILNEVVGGSRNGIEKMLEESPSTAGKRERLKKSIQMLKESKEVVGKIIDRINVMPLIE
ncbi:Dynamin-related protein 4C [Platanthera zijinensis]|uniref:Dynamin-related protein 4C n=1 Tax=Platanthera zijinensis TaxID=2320716 RepID=A0AAP0FX26_9ASPA